MIIIIIVWSWKKINCSITADDLFWKYKDPHVGKNYLVNIFNWQKVWSKGGTLLIHSIDDLT